MSRALISDCTTHGRRAKLPFVAAVALGGMNMKSLRNPKRRPTHPGAILRGDSSAESWPRMQEALDLWEARQQPERFARIKRLRTVRRVITTAA